MISGIGRSLWSSILGPYLDFIGLGAVKIGTLKTLMTLSRCVANLFFGSLSDKIGRKTPIVFSFAVTAFAVFFIGLSINFTQFSLLIIIVSLMGGLRTPSLMAAISESTPKEKRGTAFGIYDLFNYTPMLIGSIFGGATAYFFGFNMIFNIHAILSMASMVLVLLLTHEVRSFTKTREETLIIASESVLNSIPNMIRFLREYRSYAILMVALTLHGFAYFVGISFWALYGSKEIGLAITLVGFVSAGHAFGLWLGAIPSGRLTDRIGGWPMVVIHIILTTPPFLFYIYAPSFPVALVITFISGLIGALDGPARPVIFAKMVGEENMGMAIGTTNFFVLFGRMLGPITAGVLWSTMGANSPFYIGGIINLFSLIPLAVAWRLERD